jgi:precorrin-3B methylase
MMTPEGKSAKSIEIHPGITSTQASAQVAAAWLLATHDGSVLLLADDVWGAKMV